MLNKSQPTGSVVGPAPTQPFAPGAAGTTPGVAGAAPLGTTQAYHELRPDQPSRGRIIEAIALVLAILAAIAFAVLFVWKYTEWDKVRTDIDGQIDAAVARAVSENTTRLENEFLEREKSPSKSFAGPADYGSVTFEYPKTWNVYVAKDAANGGNFEAYFNPGEVHAVGSGAVNALRFVILDTPFEQVVAPYQAQLAGGQLSMATRKVGSTFANVYTGTVGENIHGIIALFKVRDKTAAFQTDAMLFANEFYQILDSIKFIE